MSKQIKYDLPKKVKCNGCAYLETDGAPVSYCTKIKMPIPTDRPRHCIYKKS